MSENIVNIVKAFEDVPWGMMIGSADANFPSLMHAVQGNEMVRMDQSATHYVFVQSGTAEVRHSSGKFTLTQGMYAQLPGPAIMETGFKANVLRASRLGHKGMFMIGGTVEWQGRMRYIDGCTDSLLIPPTMLGDPCLNLLYFPPGINQTLHTHPSARLGTIISGRGWCRFATGARNEDGSPELEEVELRPGMAFIIRAEGMHAFRTENVAMRVMAWHPDSDFGPTHEDHPMLNRTIIDGLSAAHPDREVFRTKEAV